jgi:UDP-N-acetylmuramoyl-tripeptide--D-alanyl-D-alanine ligase
MLKDFASLDTLIQQAFHFSSHSREVASGGLFVALKGEEVDGHDFVAQVLSQNVLGVFVERDLGIKDSRIYLVPSTQELHEHLAAQFRKKFKGLVIGVGGSSGKTTTKEFLHSLLSKKYKTIKTEKSQNGRLGIPRTLEKLRDGVEVAVIEIGTDAPGDMRRNVTLVDPTQGVLVSIGEEHLTQLKNLEGVFEEERFLADYLLEKGRKFFCPRADNYLKTLEKKGAQLVPAKPEDLDSSFRSSFKEEHVLQDLTLSLALCLDLGIEKELLSLALQDLELLDGRGKKWAYRDDLWILRDHYNANPSSMQLSLKAAKDFSETHKLPLRLVLGDMLDLGASEEESHKEIVQVARSLNPESIIWVGSRFAQVLQNKLLPNEYTLTSSEDVISEDIKTKLLNSGVLLFKASRGTALEKIMDRVYGQLKHF